MKSKIDRKRQDSISMKQNCSKGLLVIMTWQEMYANVVQIHWDLKSNFLRACADNPWIWPTYVASVMLVCYETSQDGMWYSSERWRYPLPVLSTNVAFVEWVFTFGNHAPLRKPVCNPFACRHFGDWVPKILT